jgi:hypothetical protein
MTLVLIVLSVLLAYYAYWLLNYEPFKVVCRSAPCEFGPYGWSAALLSSGCAVLLLVMSDLFISLKKQNTA